MSEMQDPAYSSVRLDHTFKDQPGRPPGQQLTEQNTDKMGVLSREREGESSVHLVRRSVSFVFLFIFLFDSSHTTQERLCYLAQQGALSVTYVLMIEC